jgi:Caspase domain
MKTRTCLCIAAMLVVAILSPHRADAQVSASDDPLQHGHALLIGNSHYTGWAQLDDIPFQVGALQRGLKGHFDSVDVALDLETEKLRRTIKDFLQKYGNDTNARLFLYYAGHGYTEVIPERNENRGYITGIDIPRIDSGTQEAYDAARLKAITMADIRTLLEDARAKSILFVFDSCFAGTIFTDRAGDDRRPLAKDKVAQLMDNQARDFITAGTSDQRVPAHSPIPELFLMALNGAADPYHWGVISAAEIHTYLLDRILRMQGINITPQVGKLPNPAYTGAFLFRVINPAIGADQNETIKLYKLRAN